MSETRDTALTANSLLLPSDYDKVAQINAEIYDGMCGFPETAAAIDKSVRTLERIVRDLNIPVYRTGRTRKLKPRELRAGMEAEAQRQLEERQQAKLPRPVGRPRTAAPAASGRTAGRTTKPVHEARETARK